MMDDLLNEMLRKGLAYCTRSLEGTYPHEIDHESLTGIYLSGKRAGEAVLEYELSRRWLWNGVELKNDKGGLN